MQISKIALMTKEEAMKRYNLVDPKQVTLHFLADKTIFDPDVGVELHYAGVKVEAGCTQCCVELRKYS